MLASDSCKSPFSSRGFESLRPSYRCRRLHRLSCQIRHPREFVDTVEFCQTFCLGTIARAPVASGSPSSNFLNQRRPSSSRDGSFSNLIGTHVEFEKLVNRVSFNSFRLPTFISYHQETKLFAPVSQVVDLMVL